MSNQQIYLTMQKLQDQDLVEFFDDTITYLKGRKVPFLSKYGPSLTLGQVVPLRDFLLSVIQVGLRKSPTLSTLDFVKEGIQHYVTDQDYQMEPKMIEILSICVFSRREELRRVLTELVFQQSVDKHLVDYNYNVELVMASDKCMKVNEPMLILELYLRGGDGKDLERVIIELNRLEAKAFVGKIKDIERELVGASQ